jgi:hypothetical protein
VPESRGECAENKMSLRTPNYSPIPLSLGALGNGRKGIVVATPALAVAFRPPNFQVPSATRDRFSFPTGRGGFRQKAALILFPEAIRQLPAARHENIQALNEP